MLGPVYTKRQHQRRVNAAMTLIIQLSMESIRNELQPHSGVILFVSIISNEIMILVISAKEEEENYKARQKIEEHTMRSSRTYEWVHEQVERYEPSDTSPPRLG